MGNTWKAEILLTILNLFRPYNGIDVLKLPFLEELYEKTFVVLSVSNRFENLIMFHDCFLSNLKISFTIINETSTNIFYMLSLTKHVFLVAYILCDLCNEFTRNYSLKCKFIIDDSRHRSATAS